MIENPVEGSLTVRAEKNPKNFTFSPHVISSPPTVLCSLCWFFHKSSSPRFLCGTLTATVPIFWWRRENECMSGKIAPLLSILGIWLSLIRAPLTYGGWAFGLRGLPLIWSVNMKGTIYHGVKAWWKGEFSCHWTQFHAFQWIFFHAGIKH